MTPLPVNAEPVAPVIGLHDGYIFSARADGYDIYNIRGDHVKVENGMACSIRVNVHRAQQWITGQINANLIGRNWLD